MKLSLTIFLVSVLLLSTAKVGRPNDEIQRAAAAAQPAEQNQPRNPRATFSQQQTSPQPTADIDDTKTYNYYGNFNYVSPKASTEENVWVRNRAEIEGVSAIVVALFTIALFIVAALQARTMYSTFVADHRPRLGIHRIALLTVPDEILTPDNEGKLKQSPVEVRLQLINRGGSDAQVIEGNVTLKVDSIESIGEMMRQKVVLPPFDIVKGTPVYSDDRDSAKGEVIKPAEPYSLTKTMPPSESRRDAAYIYMAAHHERGLDTIAFHVFGFFKYSSPSRFRFLRQRTYYTAFCRRYDAGKGGFVVTNEPDYEYEV